MNELSAYALRASYFRAGLRIGLVPGAEAIVWADHLILSGAAPPREIFDIAVAPPSSPEVIINALRPLAVAEDSLGVVRALLDRVRRDLFAGRTTLDVTMVRLLQLRRTLRVPEPLDLELMALDEDYSLVTDGIAGDIPTINGIVRTFLAQFDGAEDALITGAG